jgi:site-specific recombinase XerD
MQRLETAEIATHCAPAAFDDARHSHMLWHACGLSGAIQGRLGHRSLISTAVYTALAPNRLKDFWRD